MKKLLLTLIVVSFAGFCFAPIELDQKPVNGYKPDQATEGKLQQQQGEQKTFGEVGKVPEKTDDNGTPVSPDGQSDKGAQNILGGAQNRLSAGNGDDPRAKQVLSAAEQNLESKHAGWTSMFTMGFVFLCLGFGVVFGFRYWANKNMPEYQEPKKVTF